MRPAGVGGKNKWNMLWVALKGINAGLGDMEKLVVHMFDAIP
jgi:hypothetical protein